MNKDKKLLTEFLMASLDYYINVEKLTFEARSHFEELMSQIKTRVEDESD